MVRSSSRSSPLERDLGDPCHVCISAAFSSLGRFSIPRSPELQQPVRVPGKLGDPEECCERGQRGNGHFSPACVSGPLTRPGTHYRPGPTTPGRVACAPRRRGPANRAHEASPTTLGPPFSEKRPSARRHHFLAAFGASARSVPLLVVLRQSP